MLSPSKKVPNSPRTAAPLRGLFKDGIWLCNCPERLPAARFETKKPGKNQGRFCRSLTCLFLFLSYSLPHLELTRSVYTCQQTPSKKCGFFLWTDDAVIREREVLFTNSRSEIDPRDSFPRTPSKISRQGGTGLLTPQTERRVIDIPPRRFASPPKSAKARMMAEDEDEFGWHDGSSDNEELIEALESSQATEHIMSQPNFHPESPSKAARTPTMTSPGKRKLSEYAHDSSTNTLSPVATPASSRSSRIPPSSAEVCMTPTPSKYRDVLSADSKPDASNLAKTAAAILDKYEVVLPNRARDELNDLLNQQDLKMQGIVKGRERVRLAMQKKDKEILDLKEKNASLQAQSQVDRNIIDAMKR